MKVLLPEGWKRPRGYANGVSARGRLVFTSGIIGWDDEERIVAGGLVAQFSRALANILAILAEDGAGPMHIARMIWYVTDVEEYRNNLKPIGALWRDQMGENYPAMAVVEVKGLVEPDAMIEIEAIAVLEDT